MTDDNRTFGERIRRMEQDIAEISRVNAEIREALLGGLDGQGGLLGRVRAHEAGAQNHDLRLVALEREMVTTVKRADFDELAERVQTNEEFRKRLTYYVLGAATGGALGGGGLTAIIIRVIGG